jgi:hypothetical protein
MNETIQIGFRHNGQFLPIQDFNTLNGIVFSNETDTFPRQVDFWLDGTRTTQVRVGWVLQMRGWSRLKLHSELLDGMLLLRGIDENGQVSPSGLPWGTYRTAIAVEDQPLSNPRQDFEIKENGQVRLLFDLQPDERQIVFTGPLTARIKEIVDASTIEERPASEWLADPTVRASRRACLLNILAKASCFPTLSDPFISHIQNIFLAAPDRIYATVDAALQPMLARLAADSRKPVYHEGNPTSACHKRLLEVVKKKGLPGAGAPYKQLDSYRQEGGPCLQFVLADPDGVAAPCYADIDIDLGNPLQDLAGLIVHAGEVLSGKLTDHLAMRKTLGKNKQVAQFLCYDVVPGVPA